MPPTPRSFLHLKVGDEVAFVDPWRGDGAHDFSRVREVSKGKLGLITLENGMRFYGENGRQYGSRIAGQTFFVELRDPDEVRQRLKAKEERKKQQELEHLKTTLRLQGSRIPDACKTMEALEHVQRVFEELLVHPLIRPEPPADASSGS